MNKLAGILIASCLIFFGTAGCNNSRRTVNNVAPVATYSLTYTDSFTSVEQLELRSSIAAILSQLQLQNPPVVFNVNINITRTHVNINVKGRKVLVFCGEYNELPELYENLCRLFVSNYYQNPGLHKGHGKNVERENRHRNRH